MQQGEFDLSFFQDGLLAPVFLIGLLVASPIFAEVGCASICLNLSVPVCE